MNRCGIQHKHGGQTCIREKGHDGLCRSKTEPVIGGAIQYSEWKSQDGEFLYHVGYRAMYPANAEREAE